MNPEATIARDLQGRQVLSTTEAIDPPGWSVFVDQPLEEAFAPLYASILRTQVAVRDTGIGIAHEDRARIFEEFRQAEHRSAKTHEGTGLGLALSTKFVELHGGRIWVESVVGVGSTFKGYRTEGPRPGARMA